MRRLIGISGVASSSSIASPSTGSCSTRMVRTTGDIRRRVQVRGERRKTRVAAASSHPPLTWARGQQRAPAPSGRRAFTHDGIGAAIPRGQSPAHPRDAPHGRQAPAVRQVRWRGGARSASDPHAELEKSSRCSAPGGGRGGENRSGRRYRS
jgi:hypothetical protein